MAKLLIIDDDELLRSLLCATLVQCGHTVVEGSNGAEGLKLLKDTEPDLIITDLVMPEMEGFEFLMNLEKVKPRVKIIVMSGGVRGLTVDFLEIATRFGAASVLAKPFSTDALISAIDALLPVKMTSAEQTV